MCIRDRSTNMRSERKARISGLAGTEHARNRTLPDLIFPVTEWDLGTRLSDCSTCETQNVIIDTFRLKRELLWISIAGLESSPYGHSVRKMRTISFSRSIILATGKALFGLIRCALVIRTLNLSEDFVFCVKPMINYVTGIFIIKLTTTGCTILPSSVTK